MSPKCRLGVGAVDLPSLGKSIPKDPPHARVFIQGMCGTLKIIKLLTKIIRFYRVKHGRRFRLSVNVVAKGTKRTCEVYSYFFRLSGGVQLIKISS